MGSGGVLRQACRYLLSFRPLWEKEDALNFLIVTLGSHGDVHPFVGIGAALKLRGHDVTLITNAHFESLARREAIDFIGVGSSEQYLQLAANRDLWSKRKGFRVVFDSVLDSLPN